MVTRYKYSMRIDLDKLIALADAATGRAADGGGQAGVHFFEIFYDDTDITTTQRQDLINALPAWVRQCFSFTREVVEVEE